MNIYLCEFALELPNRIVKECQKIMLFSGNRLARVDK